MRATVLFGLFLLVLFCPSRGTQVNNGEGDPGRPKDVSGGCFLSEEDFGGFLPSESEVVNIYKNPDQDVTKEEDDQTTSNYKDTPTCRVYSTERSADKKDVGLDHCMDYCKKQGDETSGIGCCPNNFNGTHRTFRYKDGDGDWYDWVSCWCNNDIAEVLLSDIMSMIGEAFQELVKELEKILAVACQVIMHVVQKVAEESITAIPGAGHFLKAGSMVAKAAKTNRLFGVVLSTSSDPAQILTTLYMYSYYINS